MKIFISYSHKDETALEQLHIHLEPLRREELIDAWFDRDILAGSEIDASISKELQSCELFLPLVSPNFLASNYCVENEMQQALKRHETGEIRIIPLIIEPCDWTFSALRKLKALPRDGKPISDWTNPNHAYLDVVKELRRIVESDELSAQSDVTSIPSRKSTMPQSVTHRYRVQRSFDEIDRIDFLETAFETIRDYFQKAIDEINTIDGLRGRFTSSQSDSFSCVVVNKARNHDTAHIAVRKCNRSTGFGDISYSFTEHAMPNSMSGCLYIESDEYELYFRTMLGFGDRNEHLTPEDATKRLWEEFLEQAGITHD